MAQPDYSVPSWIHGANPLQSITTGAELGVRIAESNQRAAIAYAELQRRQQEFQQTMEMHQQQLEQEQAFQQQRLQAQQQIQEQNQMRDDQKLMIENAYRQGQLGLQKQKLELTAQAAAQKMQAQEKFLFDRETIKNSLIYEEGVDPDEAERRATIQAMFRNAPALGVSPASLAGMAKSVGGQEAQWRTSPSGLPYAQEPSGNIRFEPRAIPNPVFPADKAEIADITSNIRALDKRFQEEPNQEKKGQIEDEIIRLAETRSAILKKAQKGPQAPQVQGPVAQSQPETILALPKTKDDLVEGKTYQTSRGPATWDGKQFMPVTESALQSPEHPSNEE